MLDRITPLVLTLNEEANIGRCLAQLRWAKRIVVVDSYSTDGTLEIIRTAPQADVFQRPFDQHAPQCNFGIEHIETEWTLSLDADYFVTDDLLTEIAGLAPPADTATYTARFRYCVFGRPLRGTLYPPRPVLFRTAAARYVSDGHAHRLSGPRAETGAHLRGWIDHDDRKPLAEWLRNQLRYASMEVEKLTASPARQISMADRIRRIPFLAPLVVAPYCLLLKRGLIDGWPGLHYAAQRTLAELLLSLILIDWKLRSSSGAPPDNGHTA